MITCFLCNGLAMGINNAYGVIYVRLVEELEGDPNAASKACKCYYLTYLGKCVISAEVIVLLMVSPCLYFYICSTDGLTDIWINTLLLTNRRNHG